MADIKPIYTSENVAFAYQLRWAMTLFLDGSPPALDTLSSVALALEQDGIRVLSKRYTDTSLLQLTLSTLPHVSPATIVQRVKGRLWYAWQSYDNIRVERHYALRSYGTQERSIIEAYISSQSSHHLMATDRANDLFNEVNFMDRSVHLDEPKRIEDSLLWFNLHIVMVHAQKWRNVNRSLVENSQKMVRSVCKKYGWRLSRCGIVADHLHLSLGANASDSVQDVVLLLMNNLAFVFGMKPVYQYGAYVATFGEYDQRAIRRGE